MTKVIYLIKGEAYFHATYFPEEPYHPAIETYIYDGEKEDLGHVFINPEDGTPIIFENNEITCLYDRERLAEWILKPADFSKPLEEYEYVAL